jgi:hypothetical protein
MEDYEKLGAFYLGRLYDLSARKPKDGLVLYDSRDLVTHAVCVGMTGSGKTGLCIGLIEEAAIDGVPAIVIDPKGDLSNMLLTFPDLRGTDFRPWINEDDARRKGVEPDAFAEQQADLWKNGLEEWGQSGERIRRLRDAAEFAIYTPGSTAGLPVSVLGSLAAPPAATIEDAEAFNEQVSAAAGGLLGLLKIDADPVQSREQILLASIIGNAWKQGIDLDLASLVQQIQSPPLKKVGVMDLESFYPSKERFTLAMSVNNLLASPGFEAWLQGDPLDIGRILHTGAGKPRVAIFSIAHLGDAERMFFVSFLLNRMIGWMRSQSGTTSLRAVLYMDEIFGFFPPVANPPSKTPLLTLLKQARAYGLGVVLATQNPVDLDYKGLSNAGTWFIGRLQTERDKARVLDGLEGAAAAAGSSFERAALDRILSGLGSRVFLLNNVHEDAPEVFESRWTLSYLRGPLSRDQIRRLMDERRPEKGAVAAAKAGSGETTPGTARGSGGGATGTANAPETGATPPSGGAVSGRSTPAPGPVPARPGQDTAGRMAATAGPPSLPPDVPQFFVMTGAVPGPAVYVPKVLGSANIRFVDKKSGVDETVQRIFVTPVTEEAVAVTWDDAAEAPFAEADLGRAPAEGAIFGPLPAKAAKAASYALWTRDFTAWLQRAQKLDLMMSPSSGQVSKAGESERDFRIRLQQTARETRDETKESLRAKYAPKIASLQNQLQRAEQAAARESSQAAAAEMQTAISVGATLLGAFLGRRAISVGTIGRATTAARGAARSMKEKSDVQRANQSIEQLRAQLADLEAEFQAESDSLAAKTDPLTEPLEPVTVTPARKDITVRLVALVWTV